MIFFMLTANARTFTCPSRERNHFFVIITSSLKFCDSKNFSLYYFIHDNIESIMLEFNISRT